MNPKRKRYLIILIIVLAVAAGVWLWAQVSGPAFNRPESVAFDPVSGDFLISNVGNGTIVTMDSTGSLGMLIDKGLSKPRGLKMLKDVLWVTDDTQVHAIDVAAKKIVASIPIPGSVMLNDIEADELGALYISDTRANCLWLLDPLSKKLEKVTDKLMSQPNGIYFDAPRRQMLIVSLGEKQPILAFNTKTRGFSVFMDTIYSRLDGIQADDPGRIFFSSWAEKAIYMIPQTQNRFEIYQKDLTSPADFYWHQPTNELIVPLMEKNKVIRVPLDE
ncbi:MAG: SMP-30/gluconolactonase/LRE family protein [Candidatus Cloacimonetes bacterium]|nr:SMP-30/gluconolactonase/LRE family protein [Candidatus Cloacimonadota bacterium]HNZ06292.1 hypothetical protein [Candidatus Cloacimonadota bacterium]HPN39969.1 hypothetical protein [Candidatus Cloacimonadota bacterium]